MYVSLWRGSAQWMDQMVRLVASTAISDRLPLYRIYGERKAGLWGTQSKKTKRKKRCLARCLLGFGSHLASSSDDADGGCSQYCFQTVRVCRDSILCCEGTTIGDIDAGPISMHSIITYPALQRFLKTEGTEEVDTIKWEYRPVKKQA